jgi:predicted metal-dependent phosphoesterase TrpH
MKGTRCWMIEDYAYRPCPEPAREFHFAVSPHNHSCHSIENLASLNQVVKLWFMRPFRRVLQWAFGLAQVPDLDYADVYYRAPLTVEDVFLTESAAVALLGFDGVHLGITDHDEVSGSIELLRQHPANAHRAALGEELSIRFQNYVFHLGVTDLPESGVEQTHANLQSAARAERLDDLFEILRASGCLVVLNHPLVPWSKDKESDPHRKIPVEDLLRRYGWAIHALEYNGMRGQKENDRVLELARRVNKPVVGGGDSHLLLASSVLSLTQATSYRGFAEEVKQGRAVPLVTPPYFAPLRWKLFLRVLYFIAHYRQIGHFRGQPVRDLLAGRAVFLDPAGVASRGFLRFTSSLGLIR